VAYGRHPIQEYAAFIPSKCIKTCKALQTS